jgi:hypothetical protein
VVDFGMAHVLKKKKNAEDGAEPDDVNNYDDESIDVGPGEGTFAYWSPEMMEGRPYGRPGEFLF